MVRERLFRGFRASVAGAVAKPLRGPGQPSRWDAAFEAENQRRLKEDTEIAMALAKSDTEPNRPAGNDHELIWVTTQVAVCVPCRRTYRKVKLPDSVSVGRAEDLEEYMEQIDMYGRMAPILSQRQEKRKAEDAERDKARRGAGFKGGRR